MGNINELLELAGYSMDELSEDDVPESYDKIVSDYSYLGQRKATKYEIADVAGRALRLWWPTAVGGVKEVYDSCEHFVKDVVDAFYELNLPVKATANVYGHLMDSIKNNVFDGFHDVLVKTSMGAGTEELFEHLCSKHLSVTGVQRRLSVKNAIVDGSVITDIRLLNKSCTCNVRYDEAVTETTFILCYAEFINVGKYSKYLPAAWCGDAVFVKDTGGDTVYVYRNGGMYGVASFDGTDCITISKYNKVSDELFKRGFIPDERMFKKFIENGDFSRESMHNFYRTLYSRGNTYSYWNAIKNEQSVEYLSYATADIVFNSGNAKASFLKVMLSWFDKEPDSVYTVLCSMVQTLSADSVDDILHGGVCNCSERSGSDSVFKNPIDSSDSIAPITGWFNFSIQYMHMKMYCSKTLLARVYQSASGERFVITCDGKYTRGESGSVRRFRD